MRRRTDVKKLVSMYEQQKHILQVTIEKFEDEPAAAAWLVMIAEKFCAGKSPRSN